MYSYCINESDDSFRQFTYLIRSRLIIATFAKRYGTFLYISRRSTTIAHERCLRYSKTPCIVTTSMCISINCNQTTTRQNYEAILWNTFYVFPSMAFKKISFFNKLYMSQTLKTEIKWRKKGFGEIIFFSLLSRLFHHRASRDRQVILKILSQVCKIGVRRH